MRPNKNVKKHIFVLNIIFSFLCIAIFTGVSLAASGLKITKPLNGSTVTPGQEITVTIEAVGGFVIKEGVANIAGSLLNVNITALPVTFADKIPMNVVSEAHISVFAKDALGNMAVDDVTLKVQQTATLQSLTIYADKLLFETDWDGNIKSDYDPYKIGGVYGIYSDGVKRYLGKDPNTTYASSDPSIISINSTGKVEVHKVGDAKITISNSGVNLDIPIVFIKPSGIRPSETIPPTVSIDIQPSANSAGWYNKDITITIIAKDNEGGSGVEEIDYEFPYLRGNSADVKGSQAVIPFSEEGINLCRYVAYDNERNSTGQQSTEIQLDKTPPSVSLDLQPYAMKLPVRLDKENLFLPRFYKLVYSAADKLSGVKELKAGLVIPNIEGFKTRLVTKSRTQININEKTRRITIFSPNPAETLNQLKSNKLFLIDNNQIMHLNERPKSRTWTIRSSDKYLLINAPSISFRVVAKDNADNTATQDIKYIKKKVPLPDYLKPLIARKALTSAEIEELQDDAVIDAQTQKLIRKNYGARPD